MTRKTELIVALDVPHFHDAVRLIHKINHPGESNVTWFKVGLELFIGDAWSRDALVGIVPWLKKHGYNVMLDLKLHDIPETVHRATKQAIDMGADMLTIHAGGGAAMLDAAAKANDRGQLQLLAVTVLTSMGDNDLRQVGVHKDHPSACTLANDQVYRLAKLAAQSGVHGFVCSVQEAKTILDADEIAQIVTPGIRPAGTATNDQKRVGTPAFARDQGAKFIVVGRPIRDAEDPRAATIAINDELAAP